MVEYSLFKYQRIGQDQYYWFVQFKDPETGKQCDCISIDILSRKLGDNIHHVTKKPEAENIVQRAITFGLHEKGGKEHSFQIDSKIDSRKKFCFK